MKHNYIKIITFIALVSILFLQGIWLYNTYTLMEGEFKKKFDEVFLNAVEKEAYTRVEHSARRKEFEGRKIYGVHPYGDHYENILILNDIYSELDLPISFEVVDSILEKNIKENFKQLDYSLCLVDSLDNKIAFINHGIGSNSLSYQTKIQLKNAAPEFIVVNIPSPYKIIFRQMLLLLFGSLGLAIVVIYCLFLQIKIIVRQNRIAEIRQDFTYAMIHDMKNPITSILMGVNALKGGKLDAKPKMKENYYDIISKEGEHLLSIANKILIIAQFEEDKITLFKKPIALDELIHDLTQKYQLNTAKDIQFQIALNGIETIYGDYEYIYESFNNIIDNAVKYSKEKANISITGFIKGNYTQIKFKDDGIGISAKDKKIIFEKFERASAVQKEQKISGFGLGLNYVYQVIRAHGGKIELDSVLGAYSEFTINLPNNDKATTD
ncbi:sensor histidine kinase [Bacteroidia bacterium]|nr:sensor histidine kinase [Bacteroidia bacterium]